MAQRRLQGLQGVLGVNALGLTPLVFVITAMFPEAGGSSSFARQAFNEFVLYLAAWAQMLNYVITVAISAFFVPHLGLSHKTPPRFEEGGDLHPATAKKVADFLGLKVTDIQLLEPPEPTA